MRVSPNAMRVHEKRRDAIRLRQAGASYTEIAQTVGYASGSGAFHAVKIGLAQSLQQAGSEEVRALEAERLDRLQRGIWQAAAGGDLKAVEVVLKIMDRRAKLLGLDSPTPVHVTGSLEHTHAHLVVDGSAHGLADIFAALSEVRGDHPVMAGPRAIEAQIVGEPQVDVVHPNGEDAVPEAGSVPEP